MASIDTTHRDTFGYMLIFTSANDFNEAQEDQIVQWHRRRCENALLVRELHTDGRKHYHSTILVLKPKTSGGVSRQLATLYKSMGIDVVARVTYQVKSTSDQIGSFHYLLKDQADREPLLIMGWQLTWIKAQCVSNVKKIPRKMLMQDRVVLNAANAIPYCLKFAEAAGVGITGKESFKTLVRLMVKDGYSFDKCNLPWLYAQLMCIAGDDRVLDQHIDGLLQFLD